MVKEKNEPGAAEHEASCQAILHAAVREFALLGEAGARMETIARSAGVNKALLHYYFGTKERLYGAALDSVFQGLREHLLAALKHTGSSGEKILRFALAHFDYLASNLAHPRLVGYEMMRARTGGGEEMRRLFRTYLAPARTEAERLFTEGITSGELRHVATGQVFLSIIGQNVFYFIAAPINRVMHGSKPFEHEPLQRHREAILDFAAAALFTDREAGLRLAQEILSQTTLVVAEPPQVSSPIKTGCSPRTPGRNAKNRLR